MSTGITRRSLLSLPLGLAAAPVCRADIAPYRLTAGDFAPFTQEKGPAAPGALTEIVQAMSARIGPPVSVEFFPWQRAQTMPLKLSRVATLPMTRIPEREALYQWLVPLYSQDFLFIRKATDHLDRQASVEQMRTLKIGSVRGTASIARLRGQHFPRVVETNNHEELWRMLNQGMVDAICGGRVIELYNLKLLGYNAANFVLGPALEKREIWLAGSKDFTVADVEAWTGAMKAVRHDGLYAQVLKRYGLPE
jgi:polar amino acid transport system substrate-binding protein